MKVTHAMIRNEVRTKKKILEIGKSSVVQNHNLLKTYSSFPLVIGENHVDVYPQDKTVNEQHFNTLILLRRTEVVIEAITQSTLSDMT